MALCDEFDTLYGHNLKPNIVEGDTTGENNQ